MLILNDFMHNNCDITSMHHYYKINSENGKQK